MFLLCGIIFGLLKLECVLRGVRYTRALLLVSPLPLPLSFPFPFLLTCTCTPLPSPFLSFFSTPSSFLSPSFHYLTITSSLLPPFLSPFPPSFHFLHYLPLHHHRSLPSSPPPLPPFIFLHYLPLHHYRSLPLLPPPSLCFITSPLHHCLLFCRSD